MKFAFLFLCIFSLNFWKIITNRDIYSLLCFRFYLISQKVIDESDGCGGKFNVIIVSSEFEGESILQRHRLVNTALAEELKTIHAFSQKTYTPEQWAKEQEKSNDN